jgi:hypothetical protein
MKKVACAAALTALLCAIHPQPSAATSFNVDFGTSEGVPASSYGAAAGQAGAWNGIGATGSTNLVGLNGAALPGVSLNLSPVSSVSGDIGGSNYTYSIYDHFLIQDNFYDFAPVGGTHSHWEVTLSGLDNGNYNLYVYGPRNSLVDTSAFSVNGVVQNNLHTPSGGSSPLIEGVDYEIVQVLVLNHTIDMVSAPDAGTFSGLAGLQLIYTGALAATPLPGTLPLFAGGLGMIGLLASRRKARRMRLGDRP